MQLDIAFPRGPGPYPAVVILHGSGKWSRGRKFNLPQVFELAQKGYVAVAVSYRQLPTDPFPQALHDAKCAIRWLRAHAKEYRIDPDHIGVIGFSAGGTLGLLLALMPATKELEGDGGHAERSSAIQAAVAYFAPTDFTELANHKPVDLLAWAKALYVQDSLKTWLGGGPKDVPERYRQVSPITYARKAGPPLLLLHGDLDDLVPADQSRAFARKMKMLGGEVEYQIFGNAGHDFDLAGPEDWKARDRAHAGARAKDESSPGKEQHSNADDRDSASRRAVAPCRR